MGEKLTIQDAQKILKSKGVCEKEDGEIIDLTKLPIKLQHQVIKALSDCQNVHLISGDNGAHIKAEKTPHGGSKIQVEGSGNGDLKIIQHSVNGANEISF